MDTKLTGKIISEKRKEKGLNQLQLAELLNVSNRTISKWENGDGFPDITLLPDISSCLGITIDYLLTGEEPVIDDSSKFEEKKSSEKSINNFKLFYVISLVIAAFSAILGTINELYCIWAFPILFYTHWEIIFAAASFAGELCAVLSFIIGIHNLHMSMSVNKIIIYIKNRVTVLFAILALFPLSFIARIIDFSRLGLFTPAFMIIIILALTAMVIFFRKKINEKSVEK